MDYVWVDYICILWSGNSARVPWQLMICSTATPPDLGVAPEPLPESLHLIPEFRDYPHSPGGLHLNFHRVSRDCREFGLMRMALKLGSGSGLRLPACAVPIFIISPSRNSHLTNYHLNLINTS